MTKLNAKQMAVLFIAHDSPAKEVTYSRCVAAGGNGKTLQALVDRGLLAKHTYPDGSNVWCITDAGREVMRAKA